MTLDHISEPVKQAVDLISVGALLATMLDLVVPATAVLVLIWTCLRIYEEVLTIRKQHRDARDAEAREALVALYDHILTEPVPDHMLEKLRRLK